MDHGLRPASVLAWFQMDKPLRLSIVTSRGGFATLSEDRSTSTITGEDMAFGLRYLTVSFAAAVVLAGLLPSPSARAGVTVASPSADATSSKSAQGETGEPPARGLTAQVFSTGDSRFDVSPNQGWWSDTVPNVSRNSNYAVGACCDGKGREFRNFFSFDLGDLRGHVVSARLEFFTGLVEGDAQETVRFFDVSTPAGTLNDNHGTNANIFRDLGSGRTYGAVTVRPEQSRQWVSVPLGGTVIRDINAATRFFSIGGRLMTVDDVFQDQYLGGYTESRNLTARLVVRTTPTR